MPKRPPVTGQAELFLRITTQSSKGKDLVKMYSLRWLPPTPKVANPIWRLRSSDASEYDVHRGEHGPMCTCPDFVWCRDHKDARGCKHVAAMRSVGLLRPRE